MRRIKSEWVSDYLGLTPVCDVRLKEVTHLLVQRLVEVLLLQHRPRLGVALFGRQNRGRGVVGRLVKPEGVAGSRTQTEEVGVLLAVLLVALSVHLVDYLERVLVMGEASLLVVEVQSQRVQLLVPEVQTPQRPHVVVLRLHPQLLRLFLGDWGLALQCYLFALPHCRHFGLEVA